MVQYITVEVSQYTTVYSGGSAVQYITVEVSQYTTVYSGGSAVQYITVEVSQCTTVYSGGSEVQYSSTGCSRDTVHYGTVAIQVHYKSCSWSPAVQYTTVYSSVQEGTVIQDIIVVVQATQYRTVQWYSITSYSGQ